MVGSIVCNAGSREGRERGETVVCTSGTREAIDRQETVMDIGGTGIIPSIAAAMMDCAGIGLVVNRIEPGAEIASIGSNSSVIALTVHCIVSNDVVNMMEAIVDTASVGCTSSGVALIVYRASSTEIVHGVNSTVLVAFTGMVPLTIVSNGSGESSKGAQVTVESIISSGGGERILVDWVTAERGSLNSVFALVVGYSKASEGIEVVAGSITVDGVGAIRSMNRVVRCLVTLFVACSRNSKAVRRAQCRLRTIADVCRAWTEAVGALVVSSARAGIMGRLHAVVAYGNDSPAQKILAFFFTYPSSAAESCMRELVGGKCESISAEGRLEFGSLAAEGREGSEEGRPMRRLENSRYCKAVAKKVREMDGGARASYAL